MKAVYGFLFGLILSLALAFFAGENPIFVARILFTSAFGSFYDLGLTLFYTTSFIFTGLSVAFAFHSGLFNIGAEGQLNVAALATAAVGITFVDTPFWLALPLGFVTAIATGASWAWIAGYLKAYRGSHEVIVTMMLNFVAAGLVSFFTLEVFRSQSSQNPETANVGPGFYAPDRDLTQRFFDGAPVNFSLWIALILAFLIYGFLFYTRWGFKVRLTGQNAEAAEFSGISSKKVQMLSMATAGAAAGLVALNEVMGSAGRFKLGFSADYGFVGIAVALLARNHPLGILASAFLFGALQKGAADLDFETENITRDFARLIQAILILSVAAFYSMDLSKIKAAILKRGKHGS
jgi:simple sugar transport system permease protein